MRSGSSWIDWREKDECTLQSFVLSPQPSTRNFDRHNHGGITVRKILLIIIAVFSLSSVARADGFTTYGTRADQNPTDIIDWGQLAPPGTLYASPQSVLTFNGITDTVANINGTNFISAQEGTNWGGNFDYGESLIWTGNPNFVTAGPGPLLITLGSLVGSFGFSIQADLYGAFTTTVQALDCSSNPLFSQTFSGVSNGLENGSALFVGMGDTTGVNICQIQISTDSGNPSYINDFAIDDVSFTDTVATPEPASLFLVGSALLGMAGVRRRKSRK
jgi:hypothetical protein